MAHLYKRKASAFWWIKFRDARTAIIRRQSTGFLIGNGPQTRQARELEARRTLDERQCAGGSLRERFAQWVPQFIDDTYAASPQSRIRYHAAWRTLAMFLDDHDVLLPRQLTFGHCERYLKWREQPDKENGKYRASRNTAILELKFLAIVMRQAVRKGFAQGNPARELGLKRSAPKTFAEYTDDDIAHLVKSIRNEPADKQRFLWPSFLVAYYHGVRLEETHVNPLTDVALWAQDGHRLGSITFLQKGKRRRTKPLHPELIPMLDDAIAAGANKLFERPKSFAKEWHNFLKRCGLKTSIAQRSAKAGLNERACFHSLRVTVNNRLRRAGVPKEIREKYLTHEHRADVNSIYDRIQDSEMRVCHAALARTWD